MNEKLENGLKNEEVYKYKSIYIIMLRFYIKVIY